MLDHVLGRPSVTVRKWQVLSALFAWTVYLLCGHRHGPPGLRRISSILSRRLSAWQTIVLVGLAHYILRNIGKLFGLECPEPLANLYEPAYFRATWATTALDAGFWTAMPIRKKWLAHMCSILFTGYYLINAEQADEKVRLVRSIVTVEHLRNSWNKTQSNPILKFGTWLLRPKAMQYSPREMRIPRPQGSEYKDPVHAWLYFDGPISTLKHQTKIILNIPGGGFVAMNPRTHDDALMAWAAKTGIPILSLDYRKAPEYPYPYALHECFDVYRQSILSCGRCAGLFTGRTPQIVISGDSAGGNLAAGVTLMILDWNKRTRAHAPPTPAALESRVENLPKPAGLVLVYPCLDVNIGNWMTDEQMRLIRDKISRSTNQRVLRRKDSVFMRTANTPYASDGSMSPSPSTSENEEDIPKPHLNLLRASSSLTTTDEVAHNRTHDRSRTKRFHTPIAVPSMLSYFSDRILTPEMMRAMIILYIGNQNRKKPDFAQDYYLSPVLAPDELLQQFPRCYFLTGERDPLVDDTCIMAGRIRQAKAHARDPFDEDAADQNVEDVKVQLIPGVSHGFMQMAALYPKAYDFINLVSEWYVDLFDLASRLPAKTTRHHMSRLAFHSASDSPPLRHEILAEHNAAMSRNSDSPDSVATVVDRSVPDPEVEPHKHHYRTPTGTTATSEESDQPLELAVKPLTSSTHANGSTKKPGVLKGQSLQTRRMAELKRDRRKKRQDQKAQAMSEGDSIEGQKEAEEGSEVGSDEEAVQSPFARYHPIRSRSARNLNRRSAVNGLVPDMKGVKE